MRGFLRKGGRGVVSDSTYCGRCSDHLPDETLSYCPTCGILFSEIPPTVEYQLFSERVHFLEVKKEKKYYWLGVAASFILVFLLGVLFLEINRSKQFHKMRVSRKVVFYINNYPQFKSLDSMVTREAINIAVQSFSDHFTFEIKEWEVREASAPTYLSENKALFSSWNYEKELLSFWQKFISGIIDARWKRNPYAELPVYVSNFPLYAAVKDSPIETRHLSSSKLIGGLGSPGLVVVSSFRLINEIQEIDPMQQARYLGEYLIAHELGHALLGIKDSVISNKRGREIASAEPAFKIQSEVQKKKRSFYDECLMHTDAGGGYYMWEKIQKRKLGNFSSCLSYEKILDAHQLRSLAIRQLGEGQRKKAYVNYQKAMSLLKKADALLWLTYQWEREKLFYLSPVQAWWQQFSTL